MPDEKTQEKPDFAPKEYKTPNYDFSDTEVGKKAAADAATATKTHVVEKGENLSVIAEQELGTQSRWKEIYEMLEEATDRMEDIADVLQRVVIKNG